MLKYFSSVTTLAMVSSIAKPNAKKLKQQQKLEYLKLIFDSTDLFSLIFLELKKITEETIPTTKITKTTYSVTT